jgi:hypothetical protein
MPSGTGVHARVQLNNEPFEPFFLSMPTPRSSGFTHKYQSQARIGETPRAAGLWHYYTVQ